MAESFSRPIAPSRLLNFAMDLLRLSFGNFGNPTPPQPVTLTFYNTLTRQREPFVPLEPGRVKMYCCGVTVYDYCHLGHARSYVVWDTVRRYLIWRGYSVRYVQNFTDIDDKILNRAKAEGTTMQAIADRYTQAYFEDMDRLNILRADEYTYATHTLDGIKRLIHELEQKGFAYTAGGDVYYRVHRFEHYGKLSGRKLADLKVGASGRVDDPDLQKKEDPFDFALWKAAKPDEPAWESPWGAGRPGWHIECSAMVRDRLGDTIDIHMGGADLVFPHHENEIAQSEAVTGKPLARYWLHNGMVNVGGEKMSKSLGNFTTIRQLLDAGVEPMALRFFILQTQYRKPMDFTEAAIASAQKGWDHLKEGLQFGHEMGAQLGWSLEPVPTDDPAAPLSVHRQQFQAAMDDDINTAGALAVLFDLAKTLRREKNLWVHTGKLETASKVLEQIWHELTGLATVLGLEAQSEATLSPAGPSDAEIVALVAQRQAARQARNFAESDRIRDLLKTQGITLVDQAGGETRWYRE
ncbi:cysteine--tRNA ligase [Trichothermofontia sp.]